jgi:hypothetical protein
VPVALGVNRTAWDLRRDSFRRAPGEKPSWFEPRGPEVLPGLYRVTVRHGDHQAEGEVRVLADPRLDILMVDRQAKVEALRAAGTLQETVVDAVVRLHRTREDLALIVSRLKDEGEQRDTGSSGENERHQELLDRAAELKESLVAMEKRFWVSPETKGIVADNDIPYSRIRQVLRSFGASWEAPTPAQLAYLAGARSLLEAVLADFNGLYDLDVAAFRRQVRDAGIVLLPEEGPLTVAGGP